MIYSLRTKKEVVNQVRQGMTVREAVMTYGISRNAIRNWLNYPEKYLSDTRAPHVAYDIEEKVRILQQVISGQLTAQQAAELNNINPPTVREWMRDRDRIFAIYSSQRQLPVNTGITQCPREELPAVSTTDDKDTKQHLRDLKAENEFLKAKVAYLEALMEYSGTPVSGFKKKYSIRPSTKSSEEGTET